MSQIKYLILLNDYIFLSLIENYIWGKESSKINIFFHLFIIFNYFNSSQR